jgi:hypothetical protein
VRVSDRPFPRLQDGGVHHTAYVMSHAAGVHMRLMICSPVNRMDLAAHVACTSFMAIWTGAAASGQHTSSGPAHREQGAQTHNAKLVVVQSEWNGWRTAVVRLADLEEIHWSRPSGAPQPLLHASVCCNKFEFGNLPHNCDLTAPPHHLTVCLSKRHMAPSVFEELARRAGAAGAVNARTPGDRALRAVDSRTLSSGVAPALLVGICVGAIAAVVVIGVRWRQRTQRGQHPQSAGNASVLANAHSDTEPEYAHSHHLAPGLHQTTDKSSVATTMAATSAVR